MDNPLDGDFRDDISTLDDQEREPDPTLRPDEPMARVRMSLADYNKAVAGTLDGSAAGFPEMAQSERIDAFVLANLCGRLCVDNVDQEIGEGGVLEGNLRVFLDALHDVPQANPYRVTVTRDCDSVIGRTFDLPFTKPLAIYPLPRFADTLKKTNHMTIKISSRVSLPSTALIYWL